ncbi:MAG: hypothetical protein Q9165_007097 [Trypethelium subeluteriae]
MSSIHRSTSPYVPTPRPSEVPSSSNDSDSRSTQATNIRYPSLDNIRFPGDGLDFRRPMNSANRQETVIDLTEDTPPHPPHRDQQDHSSNAFTSRPTRPPRFDRDIIDVEDYITQEPSSQSQPQPIDLTQDDGSPAAPTAPRAPSPEVEFVSSRQISPPPGPLEFISGPTSLGQSIADFLGSYSPFNLTSPHHRALAILNRESQHHPTARLRRHVQGLDDLSGPISLATLASGSSSTTTTTTTTSSSVVHPTSFHDLTGGVVPRHHHHHHHHHHHRGTERGIRVATPAAVGPGATPLVHIGIGPEDYESVGFDLGYAGGDGRQRRMKEMLEPPPPARDGFTRSPGEEDVLVCPNCGDELGDGGEGTLKVQVWIVKGCGHVYCGDCAHGRGSAKKKGKEPVGKGKAKAGTKTGFTTCVVEGCNRKVSGPKQMLQLFL